MKTLSLLLISLFSFQLLQAKTVACDNVTDAGLIYHNSNADGLVKFCSAWQPAPISETQGASGGSGGALLYQWQYGFNGITWEDISISAGQNRNINLGSSALINFFSDNNIDTDESIYFRRGAKRPDCSAYLYSNQLEYRVYPDLSDANPPLQAGIFCNFTDPEHCVGVGNGNSTDTYEYIWEFSFDNEDYFYTSTTFPENYCYDAGTTAYFKVGSRLIGSPCEYQFKSPLEIITQLTPDWVLDITAVSCEGSNDGSFDISDESGNSSVLTDGYTYSIDNGQNWQNSSTFNGLSVGNYTVSIQTPYCGNYSESFSINASPSPSLNDIDVTDESDCGAADGSIQIQLSGGTGDFEYRLSTTSWQSSPSFNGLSTGNYDTYGRNADGSCETFLTDVTIDAPLSPYINDISVDEVSDCNADNGSINIEASGGDGPLRYSIDDGENWSSNNTFNNLSGGNYEAGVRNQDGSCAQFETVNLLQPDAPIIQQVSSDDPTDCDSDNGLISIQATANGSALDYSINNGQSWSSNSTFNNLGAGAYQIKVRKSDGSCEVSYDNVINLSTPSSPESSSIVVEQPSNCQVDDGEINIYPSNSQWDFSIDGGQSWQEGSGLFSQLGPGTYIPFIRNGDGTCASQAGNPIELSYPDQPTITAIDYDNPSDWCTSDGYLIIEASGGVGPLEYTRNGINWATSPEFTSGFSSALLSPGVRNADGSCETFWGEEILISPPDRPSIDAIIENADSGCGADDGSILIEASGGIGAYDYSIDDGASWQSSPLFEGYPSANYDIAIRNKDGSCTVTDDAYIPPLLKPRIQSFEIQAPSDCGLADASISITGDRGTGDYEFTIDGGQNWTSQSTISGLATGEYTLGIRNANGFCEEIEEDPVTIGEPAHKTITSVEVSQPSDCDLDDGELILFAQGGGNSEYSIDAGESWQNSRTFNNLAPGEYFPVVRNTNGTCYQAYDESYSLAYPPRPEYVDIETTPTSDCDVNDGEMTIILTAGTGDFEYSLDDGNSWQSSATFTNLRSTTYGKIAVRNSNGTCYEEYASTVEITEPPQPTFGVSDIDQPSDCELDDGYIETSAQQGIGSFEYSFDGGDSWQDADFINDLSPGQYLQGIRNADGTCEIFRNNPVELDYPPSPSIADINFEQPSDCGTDDGSISISAANGTGNFQYSIDGGDSWNNNGNFNNLAPGQFEIAIRNSNGTCEIFDNQEIELDYPPSPSIADINFEQPSDCGTDDGSISISAANGTGNFQYSIDGGNSWNNNGNFNNLAPGQFEIAIRNSNGTCEIFDNQEIELDYPPSPSIADINFEQPSDCGTDDGSISISAANGTGNFQYSIDGGNSWNNNGNFNNLAPGQFEIAIRNSNGTCEIFDNQEIELDYPPSPSIADINFDQPSDCGTDDGSISISASNGTGNFQYSIDGGDSWNNNGNFNNLAPGQFDIAIRNSNGTCEIFDNQEIELDYPPSPSIADIDVDQPSDCGTDDGSISISAANGTGNFQYSIDGGGSWNNNGNFNNLAPGQFDIAIRNSNGTCEIFDNQEVELDYPPSPSIDDISFDQPSDCGTDDGSISISAANGAGNFQYSIDGGDSWNNNGNFNNLAPGQFEIAIRNSNGTCEIFDNQEVELDYPPSPSIADINFEQPSDCGTDDGSISISAANGTGNFQYSIDGGDSWKNNGNFNNLAPGQFEIAIRNSNGTCEIFDNQEVELDYPPSPSIANINFDQPSDCGTDDGSISISAANGTGNFQYSIDRGGSWNNNGNFNNLAPGQFDIAIRNSNGTCEIFDNQEIELDYPPSPAIANINFEQPSDCGTDDGSISISAANGTGNFQYSIDRGGSWNNNGNFNNLAPGQFDIAIRNSNGTCEIFDNQEVELGYPPSPSIVDINFDQPSDCGTDDGSISISAANGTGNFQYSIDGGDSWNNNGNFNNLAPGQFDIAIRNSNGTCEIFDNQEIELDYPPSPSIADINFEQPSDCGTDDGSISISAANGTGNFQYSIDGGNSWNNNGNFNNLAPGQFDIAIRNSNGTCEIFDNQEIELDYPPSPAIANINFEQPSDCGTDDGSISISAANGIGNFQYSIDGGGSWNNNGNFNNLAPGQFDIAIRNSNGTCEIFDNQEIELDYPPSPSITNIDVDQPSDCGTNDGEIRISGQDGIGSYSFSIDGGNNWQATNRFTGLSPGNYEVAIQNADGTCLSSNSNTTNLSYPESPDITAVISENPAGCGIANGSIQIQVNGGEGPIAYSINNGDDWQNSPNFSNLADGIYSIKVRNGNQTCELAYGDIQLNGPSSPVIADLTANDPTDCGLANGQITIEASGGSGNFQYSINGGQNWSNNSTFSSLAEGFYSPSIRNADGSCQVDYQSAIQLEGPEPADIESVSATQPSDCFVNDGEINIQISGGGQGFQFSIDGGNAWSNNTQFTNLSPGNYQVGVRRSNGACELIYPEQIVLNYPPAPTIQSVDFDSPSDCGTDDGRITIQAQNGIGNFEYSINGGQTWAANNTFSGLAPGSYSLSVRNRDQSCEIDYNNVVVLTYPESATIETVEVENPTDCDSSTGSLLIKLENTTSNSQYSINGGANWSSSPSFSGLAAGDYQVVVRNTDGSCLIEYPATISLVDPISPIIVEVEGFDPSNCTDNNGQIKVVVSAGSGATQYSIDGGQNWQNSAVFSGLAPGLYQVVIKNGDGSCEVFHPVSTTLNAPAAPTLSGIETQPISDCGRTDAQIEITALPGSGPLAYSIDNGVSWQPSGLFTNVSPGIYQIAIQNNNGTCRVNNADLVTINSPVAPVIQNVALSNPSDCGRNNGSISIEASGSNNSLLYTIDGGALWNDSPNFDQLSPGQYTIGVKNANGTCQVDLPQAVTITALEAPRLENIEVQQAEACDNPNGRITISAAAEQAIQYSIDGGQSWSNNPSFQNLAPGQYSVSIQHTNGTCKVDAQQPITISAPSAPVLQDIQVQQAQACDNPNGSITIFAAAEQAIQYSIDGGQSWSNNPSFQNLAPGQYSVSIQHTNGTCKVDAQQLISISTPSAPVLQDIQVQQAQACDNPIGSIIISATAEQAIQYSIDGGQSWSNNPSFQNLAPGQYSVSIQHTDGSCQVDAQPIITISAPAAPILEDIQVQQALACDNPNGSITISADSELDIQYSIDGGQNWSDSSSFQNLAPGQYSVSIQHKDGSCKVDAQQVITISAPATPILEDIQVQQAQACDNPNGSITISADSELDIQYSIDGGQNWSDSSSFQNLAPGQYSVSIQHTDGSCKVDAQQAITISAPAAPILEDIQVQQALACDNPNGSITISADSELDIQYSIDGGQNWSDSSSFQNLAPGQYSVSIQHKDGSCKVDAQQIITISAPAAPILEDIQVQQAQACDNPNGSITISADSELDIQYSIDGGQNWSDSSSFQDLAPGQYSVSIQHKDGSCKVDAQPIITISAPAAPILEDIQVQQAQACDNPNGSITISADSELAIQYSIDGGQSWSDSSSFQNLAPGQYSVSIQHTDGSCKVDAQPIITISAPAAPILEDIQVQQALACDNPNGSITISADSELAIQYSIDGGQSWSDSSSFQNLAPGQYSVSIQHTDGTCKVDAQQPITISAPSAPVLQDIQVQQEQTCDNPNGSITISADSELAIQYSIDGGQNWSDSSSFQNLAPGQYSVSIQHTDGSCKVDAQQAITISAPAAPILEDIQVQQALACDNPNGSITISADSELDIQYSIDGGQNWSDSSSFQNLAPGQYSVSIQHTDGSCKVDAQQAITISAPAAPILEDIQVQQALACDNPNGSITISADSELDIQYSIDGGQNWSDSSSFQNLAPGQYSVSIQHKDGSCKVDAQQIITISAPAAPILEDIQVQQALACDNPNGSITVSATSDQVIQYSIDGGINWQADSSFYDLSKGEYIISIRNENGTCQVDWAEPVNISSAAVLSIEEVQVTPASGCGLADGQISIDLLQSNEHVLYSIDQGESWQADSIFTGLPKATYRISVLDTFSNCQIDYGQVDIEGAGSPVIENVGIILPSSCNSTDGGIFINLAEEGDFQYSIDGGINWQEHHQFNDLLAGTYFVKVSDRAGSCTSVYEIPVRLPADGAATIWQVNAQPPSTCGLADGEIDILILEEEALFDFSIDNGETWQDTAQFTGLPSDSYTVLVRNRERNCLSIYYSPLYLPEPPSYENLLIQEQRPSACGVADGSILINYPVLDTARYSIDGGINWQKSPEFLELAAGEYEVRIQVAGQSCELAHLFPLNLTFSAQQELVLDVDQPSDCAMNDGRISIQPPTSTNYLFSIDRGFTYQADSIFEGLSPGTYIIRVKDIDGNCEYEHTETIKLHELNKPEIVDVQYGHPASCVANGWISIEADSSGQSIAYSIDGGESWQNEQAVFDGLAAGSYPIAIRYANGSCFTSYEQAIILQDTSEQDTLVVSWERIICEGDTLFLGDTLLTVAGDYELFLDNQGGCDSLIQLQLRVATPTTSNIVASICEGETYQLGEQLLTTKGQYSTKLTSALGCDSIVNLELSVYQPDTTIFDITLCEGEAFYYEELSLDSAGEYTLRRSTENGCDSLIIFNLTLIPSPTITDIETSPPSSCESEDGTIRINSSSPLHLYSIDNGQRWQSSPIFQGLSSGVYPIEVRDQQTNCIRKVSVELYSTAIPLLDSLIIDPGQACQGINGLIQFVPSEDSTEYQYSINGGLSWQYSPFFDSLSAGSYELFISRADSTCSYFYQTAEIQATDSLVVDVLTQESAYCNEDSSGIINLIISQGSSPYRYEWSNGSDLPELENVSPGRYQVSITDNNNCEDSLTIYLDSLLAIPLLDSLIQDTFLICKGDTLSLAPALDNVQYKWWSSNGFSSEEQAVSIHEAGQYFVRVDSQDGCIQTDSFWVIQSEDYLASNFLLPSAGLVHTSIFAVEVSWPIPERVRWVYDESRVNHLSSYLNQEEFAFTEEGVFTIGMEAQLGSCQQYIEKTIAIYSDPDSIPNTTDPNGFNEILDFSLFPNPNDGQFELLVEMEASGPAQVRIYRDTGLLMESRNLSGWASYREAFQLTDAPSGNYIAVLQTASEYRTLNFIIQR